MQGVLESVTLVVQRRIRSAGEADHVEDTQMDS
jgi:hypothetical protein